MSARTLVKICGVNDPATALVALDAGADFVGLVFYPGSHRYVTLAQAREIADVVHDFALDGREVSSDVVGVELVSALSQSRTRLRVETSSTPTGGGPHSVRVTEALRPRVVGLFVNEPIEVIVEARELVGLDIVQLSGLEPVEDMQQLRAAGIPFIATVRAGSGDDEGPRRRFVEVMDAEPFAVIYDTHVPGMWGGSGVVGDWDLARELAETYPLFLAGGLDPCNVGAAIEAVEPFAVDVSSGVETNRIKDHGKIRSFIETARNGRQADQ